MRKTTKPKIRGYRLGKEIGRGGMSVVYSATSEKLKSTHAIKVFDVPECANRTTLAEKFTAETRLLSSLRHPNIVRVTDCGTTSDGRPWYAMDLSPTSIHSASSCTNSSLAFGSTARLVHSRSSANIAGFIKQRFASLSAESDDIIQNVMARLVAVLREGKYRRDRSRFRTYLAALVHNCCIDQMRAAARRREVPIGSIDLDSISAERDSKNTFSHLDRQWAEACYSTARRHVLEHMPLAPLHKKIFLESEQGRTSDDIARENCVSIEACADSFHSASSTEFCSAYLTLFDQ